MIPINTKDFIDNYILFNQYMLVYITMSMSKSRYEKLYNNYNYNYSANNIQWVDGSHPP